MAVAFAFFLGLVFGLLAGYAIGSAPTDPSWAEQYPNGSGEVAAHGASGRGLPRSAGGQGMRGTQATRPACCEPSRHHRGDPSSPPPSGPSA